MVTYSFHLYSHSSHHFILCFISSCRKHLKRKWALSRRSCCFQLSQRKMWILIKSFNKEGTPLLSNFVEFQQGEQAFEQCFPVVLFSMLYKMVLTLESVDEILKCDHFMKAIDRDWLVLAYGAVYYSVQGGSSASLWMESWSVTTEMKATEQYVPVVLFIIKAVQYVVLNEILWNVWSNIWALSRTQFLSLVEEKVEGLGTRLDTRERAGK